jgi:hypothetical protein
VTEMCFRALLFRTLVRVPQGTLERKYIRERLVNHLMMYWLIQVQEALE